MDVNIICRLSDEKVQASKIEVSAIVHSLIECMKYVLSRCNSDGNTDCHIGEEILQEQVEKFIKISILVTNLSFRFTCLKSVRLFIYSYFDYWKLHLSMKRNI